MSIAFARIQTVRPVHFSPSPIERARLPTLCNWLVGSQFKPLPAPPHAHPPKPHPPWMPLVNRRMTNCTATCTDPSPFPPIPVHCPPLHMPHFVYEVYAGFRTGQGLEYLLVGISVCRISYTIFGRFLPDFVRGSGRAG